MGAKLTKSGARTKAKVGRCRISASTAKQKANLALSLYCGQTFVADEPVRQDSSGGRWAVPIWLATPEDGRIRKIGRILVDAETGDLITSEKDLKRLRKKANSILDFSCHKL